MRKIAFVMLLVGAVGSLGLMVNAGRHTPVFLLVLYFGWVLSPYFALLLVNLVSKRWLAIIPATLYWLTLILSLGSLVSYSIIIIQHWARPAFIFLIVPLICWLILIFVILIAAFRARKASKKAGNL